MSMISAQCEELRERAKVLRQGRWSDGADDARLMEDAADTIWQLRDDLQRAHGLLGEADREESRAWDRVRKAEAENAKLRELVRDMMRFFEDGDYCTVCEKAAECDAQEEYDESCLMREVFHARMRELGVEVDR